MELVNLSDDKNQLHLEPTKVAESDQLNHSNCVSSSDTYYTMQNNTNEDSVLDSLSGLYAEVIIVITGVCLFSEFFHGPLPLFYIQDYLFLYLYGLGILILIGSFASKFCNRCNNNCSEVPKILPQYLSGKLIQEIYAEINPIFKAGAFGFGCLMLASSCLEISSILMSSKTCIGHLTSSQPFLRSIFIILQLLFLTNIKDTVVFGCVQNLAIMHLFSTNVAIGINILLWQSSKDWEYAQHIKHNSSISWERKEINFSIHSFESDTNSADSLKHYPTHVVHYTSHCWWRTEKSEDVDVVGVVNCLQNSSVGLIWEKSYEFCYPFLAQHCLVLGCILYTVWCYHIKYLTRTQLSILSSEEDTNLNCHRSTKGLFLGCLILFANIIVIIIFFSVSEEIIMTVRIMYCLTYGFASFAAILGLFQSKKLCYVKSAKPEFSTFFQNIGMIVIFMYASYNVLAVSVSNDKLSLMYALEAILMIVQAISQYLFILRASNRRVNEVTVNRKPGRQATFFLILSNLSLWLLDSLVSWNSLKNSKLHIFEMNAWHIILRIVIPFVSFYRFHSLAILSEIWKKSYKLV